MGMKSFKQDRDRDSEQIEQDRHSVSFGVRQTEPEQLSVRETDILTSNSVALRGNNPFLENDTRISNEKYRESSPAQRQIT
jgi:hypothetical protein